jgi:hypothetical protein
MCPGGPMGLRRYGELGGRAWNEDIEPSCPSISGGAVRRGIAAASAFWLPTSSNGTWECTVGRSYAVPASITTISVARGFSSS